MCFLTVSCLYCEPRLIFCKIINAAKCAIEVVVLRRGTSRSTKCLLRLPKCHSTYNEVALCDYMCVYPNEKRRDTCTRSAHATRNTKFTCSFFVSQTQTNSSYATPRQVSFYTLSFIDHTIYYICVPISLAMTTCVMILLGGVCVSLAAARRELSMHSLSVSCR